MIAFNLLLVAALYSGAAHAISLSPRLDCSSLGTGATDTLPSHFTLVAHDSAKNASVPLFLHNTGAIPHQSWSVLVTSQDMSFSNFSLNGGALNAFATNPNLAATAAIGNTKGDPSKFGQAGPWPTFATNGAVPAAQYCAVPSAQGTVLAINGRTNHLSLCRSFISSAANGVTAAVYDADPTTVPNANSYDGSTCVKQTVLINIIST